MIQILTLQSPPALHQPQEVTGPVLPTQQYFKHPLTPKPKRHFAFHSSKPKA